MARVLMIGAGGVGGVVAKKMAQNHAVFNEFMIASRTLSKCDQNLDHYLYEAPKQ